jgi:hypothetical protein
LDKLNKAYSFIVDRDSNVIIVGAVEKVSSFILKVHGGNGNTMYAEQVVNKTGAKSDRLFKIYNPNICLIESFDFYNVLT